MNRVMHWFMKFNKLHVETRPLSQRTYQLYSSLTKVDDEMHIIFKCPFLNTMRTKYTIV